MSLKLWGGLLTAGAIGALATTVVEESVTKSRKKLNQLSAPVDVDGDGKIDFSEMMSFYANNILYAIGWEYHKTKYLTSVAAVSWLILGVVYGLEYEKWDTMQAFYYR